MNYWLNYYEKVKEVMTQFYPTCFPHFVDGLYQLNISNYSIFKKIIKLLQGDQSKDTT